MATFAEYLEKWLKQSTAQGLTNPLVKMPVKRFRLLQSSEFDSLANGGTLIVGTMADPHRPPRNSRQDTKALAVRQVSSSEFASARRFIYEEPGTAGTRERSQGSSDKVGRTCSRRHQEARFLHISARVFAPPPHSGGYLATSHVGPFSWLQVNIESVR